MKKTKLFGSILALTLALVPTVGTVASNNSSFTNSITASADSCSGCYKTKKSCYMYASNGSAVWSTGSLIPQGAYISVSCYAFLPNGRYYYGRYNGKSGCFKESDLMFYSK